jgi:hypothetical protein
VPKANSDSPAIKRKTKELRAELANADMSEFDRMMRHLINVPTSTIDRNEKKIRAKFTK